MGGFSFLLLACLFACSEAIRIKGCPVQLLLGEAAKKNLFARTCILNAIMLYTVHAHPLNCLFIAIAFLFAHVHGEKTPMSLLVWWRQSWMGVDGGDWLVYGVYNITNNNNNLNGTHYRKLFDWKFIHSLADFNVRPLVLGRWMGNSIFMDSSLIIYIALTGRWIAFANLFSFKRIAFFWQVYHEDKELSFKVKP